MMETSVDLVDLDDISEQSILHAIEKRFQKNEIYSSLGTILIAVNPYKHLPDLYSSKLLQEMMHIDGNIDPSLIFGLQHPHVWMIARNAFLQLKTLRCSQAIVISGESGAGKTETTKKCLQYLSSLAARREETSPRPSMNKKGGPPPPPPPPPPSISATKANVHPPASDEGKGAQRIEDRILSTNPVLESFGNAKTARNNNSSRFGKWIQINYSYQLESSQPTMIGGQITQYLLEKSRVVIHSPDERNYHIFYQLCASGILDLQPAASYRYLRYSKNMKIPGVDDKVDFQLTCESMAQLGFTEPDREAIFAALKGILLLGNLIFMEDAKTGMAGISPDFHPLIVSIGKIFGWNADKLPQRFVSRSITVRGESSAIQLNTSQAQDAVNALAKEIYNRLFNFIVYQANESLQASASKSSDAAEIIHSIGLLDIFGFEKFKSNSFEQLCINYANEKLQQYFINYVLKKEQDLYRAEGIDTSEFMKIAIIDNTDVLQLFEGKKNGLFARLDDEIKLPKASDETFLKKVENDHNQSSDPSRRFFKDVKMPLTQFEVRHFAGMIRYDCLGFLEKNRDKLYDNLEELFCLSDNLLFRRIMLEFASSAAVPPSGSTSSTSESSSFRSRSKDSGGGGGGESAFSAVSSSTNASNLSIAARFQLQLQQLVDVLNASQPHFIKCVKPNSAKQESLLEKDLVLAQLRYSGVLEAIQIRKSGYPVRRKHDQFWRSYWMLAKGLSRQTFQALSDAEKCQAILPCLALCLSPPSSIDFTQEMKVGRSLVFCKSKTLQLLEQKKLEKQLFITIRLQTFCRMLIAQRTLKQRQFFQQQILALVQLLDSEDHRTDIRLIESCESLIEEVEEEELPEPIIRPLRERQHRLIQIKTCFEKLEYYSSLPERETTRSNSAQLLSEFQELQSLLSIATEFHLASPHLSVVQQRMESLRERAELVEQLLQLLEEGDDEKIKRHLSQIDQMTEKYGQFCAEEVERGKAVLKLIGIDKRVMGEIMEYLSKFVDILQAMNQANDSPHRPPRPPVGKSPSSSDSRHSGDKSDSHVIAARLLDCNQTLNNQMKLWKDRPLAFKPFAPFCQWLADLMMLHSDYSQQLWPESVQQIHHLRRTLASLASENHSQSELVQKILSLESSLMSQDLQLNYLIPKVSRVLSLEKVPILSRVVSASPTTPHQPEREAELEVEELLGSIEENNALVLGCIEEMQGYEGILISRELCDHFRGLLERLIETRQNFLEERWEQVLLSSETTEGRALRVQLLNEWYYEVKITSSDLVSASSEREAVDESFFADSNAVIESFESLLKPFLNSSQRYLQYYIPVCDLVLKQMQCWFALALERFLFVKVRAILLVEIVGSYPLLLPSHLVESLSFRYETSLLQKTCHFVTTLISRFFDGASEDKTEGTERASSPLPRNPLSPQTLPRPVTVSRLLEGLQLIIQLRSLCQKSQWTALLQLWESRSLNAFDPSDVHEGEGLLNLGLTKEILSLMREEIAALIVFAGNQYLHQFLLQQVSEGVISFSAIINEQNTSFSVISNDSSASALISEQKVSLSEGWQQCQRRISRLRSFSSEAVHPELEEFSRFVEELLKARKALQKNHSFSLCEQVVMTVRSAYEQVKELSWLSEDLSSQTQTVPIQKALEEEFEEMSLIISARQCMTLIWEALERPSSFPQDQDLDYLVAYSPNQGLTVTSTSATTNRGRTASTSAAIPPTISSPVPARLKSLSFDLGLSSPLIGSQVSSTQIEDVLKADGLMLNDRILETESLEEASVKVREFKESLELTERELPCEFLQWTRAMEGLKCIRECVWKGEWIIAQRILQELEHFELLQRFPTLAKELQRNKEYIYNYAVITSCLNALCKSPVSNNPAPILIGQPEYFKSVSTELLEEAVKLCQEIGRPSKRAEVLFNAVLTILDLRKAQKLGDWTEIRSVLTKAYAENIGAGMSDICFAEINRAIIERDNYDGIQGLKAAIINEELVPHESLLDTVQISTRELSNALVKVANMPEDTRGMVLKALYGLADTILKVRKAVQQRNWYVLENLLPVLRDNSEALQNELDAPTNPSKAGSVLQRKTMFRTSSFHRGTILNRNTLLSNDGGAGLGSPGPGSLQAGSLLRSALWDEFLEVSQSIKREIKAIEHHFAVVELDKQLNEALTTGNITSDEATGLINKSSINLEDLREAVDQATNLELSPLSLPPALKLLRKVGLLLIDIRQGVLNDRWETMSSLLEETLDNDYSAMPEVCRLEVQAVRREVENRWIVTNLSNALINGRLNGTVNDAMLREVSYSHLSSYISTAKSLHPFTDDALKLIASAEKISKLREMIVEPLTASLASLSNDSLVSGSDRKLPINWNQVKKSSKEILDELDKPSSKFHKIVAPEVKLMLDVAEDRLTRDFMEQALMNGGPTGEPGRIIITNMSTHQLEKAYQQAVRSSLKTDRAKQLLVICRSVQKLREALLRAESANTYREGEIEAWKTIRSLLQEIDSQRKEHVAQVSESSPFASASRDDFGAGMVSVDGESSWEICREEIELIQRHASVQELKNSLIDSAIRASHVYHERHQLNLHIELTKYDSAQTAELKQLCVDLDTIIQQALVLSFPSDYLQKYVACATTLRLYRSAILEGNWTQLEVLLRDHSFQSNLAVLPETKQELSWIFCELHNNQAISIIRSALDVSSTSASTTKSLPSTVSSAKLTNTPGSDGAAPRDREETLSEQDIYHKEWDLKMLHGVSFAKRNEQLKLAIVEAKRYKITSKLAMQWLECCENMYLLRSSLENRDNVKVAQALRWFKSNAGTCPDYVKLEAQRAYVIHQNDLLLHGLTYALNHGKPAGKCGAIQTHLIETQAIEDLLKQANDIKSKLAEVEELIQAAKIALMIRQALKTRNIPALKDIIADLSSNHDEYEGSAGSAFSLLIVDEIATAKGELDNEISIQALTKALKSFEDSEGKSLDLTFTRSSSGGVYHDPDHDQDSLFPSAENLNGDNSSIAASNDSTAVDEMISAVNSHTSLSLDAVDHHLQQRGLGVKTEGGKRFHASILESFSPIERRYSFANKNSANLDLETIDIDILDYGLRVARDHGIYSDRAKRLHNTVELIKSLRLALKNSDWSLLEDILLRAQYEENLHTVYDELAQKEIQTLRSQLLMRTAIVDLSKALKTGWAQCAHGIVDTSQMKNDLLLTAIEKADHCMIELSQSTGSSAQGVQTPAPFSPPYEPAAVVPLETPTKDSVSTVSVTSSSKKPKEGSTRRKSVQFAEEVMDPVGPPSESKRTPQSPGFASSFALLSSAASPSSGQKSTIEEQIKLLIYSAKLIYHIRDILSTGNIEVAGQLAEEALSKQLLHYTVIEELKLYAKEINAALLSLKLIEECKQSMMSGKLAPLEKSLRMIFSKEIHYSSDLGIIYIIVKAEARYRQLSEMKQRLIRAKELFDCDSIKATIRQAKAMHYCDVELEELWQYFHSLTLFENKVKYIFTRWIFLNEPIGSLQQVLTIAKELGFQEHPLSLQTQFLLQCSAPLLSTIRIMKCFTALVPRKAGLYDLLFSPSMRRQQSIPFPTLPSFIATMRLNDEEREKEEEEEKTSAMRSIAMSYTIHGLVSVSIQQKRSYLQLPSALLKYRLENFPHLRPVTDFSFRMGIESEELRRTFLSYSEQSLPCSLTRLNPHLSAVAVFIYSQMIRGVERSLFTYPEVIVKQMVTIGCRVEVLRDEILLLIVKQIRNHPMPERKKRTSSLYDTLHGLNSSGTSSSQSTSSYAHIVSKVQQQQQLHELLQANRLQFLEEENLEDEDNLWRFIDKQEQNRFAVFSLWRLLMICLYYFPPSTEFENYLELFLWDQYEEETKILSVFGQRYQQARNLSKTEDEEGEPDSPPRRRLERQVSTRTLEVDPPSRLENNVLGSEPCAEILNEVDYYLHKNLRMFAMRCIRYLHRSVLLYGYRQLIDPFAIPIPTSSESEATETGDGSNGGGGESIVTRINPHQYSLLSRDAFQFPALQHWLREGKDSQHILPSITVNGSLIYYPPLKMANSTSQSVEKQQRFNVTVHTSESVFDPCLPHFFLSADFKNYQHDISWQSKFYRKGIAQFLERHQNATNQQFSRRLLADPQTRPEKGGKKPSDSTSLSAEYKDSESELSEPDYQHHSLLLAGVVCDFLTKDPAFPNMPFLVEDKPFDDQLLAALRQVSNSSSAVITMQSPSSAPTPLTRQPSHVSNVSPSQTMQRLRGTREDWVARFRLLQLTGKEGGRVAASTSSSSRSGGYIYRSQFSQALGATITSKSNNIDLTDRLDRELFYFLLFGKDLSTRATIIREYRADIHIFHYLSQDEAASSRLRREWLEKNIMIPHAMSELTLSQLQTSDVSHAAERFWDSIIVKMSKECLQFPFLQFDTEELKGKMDDNADVPPTLQRGVSFRGGRKSSVTAVPAEPKESDTSVSFNWEIYREVMLIAMKKYLDQYLPPVSI